MKNNYITDGSDIPCMMDKELSQDDVVIMISFNRQNNYFRKMRKKAQEEDFKFYYISDYVLDRDVFEFKQVKSARDLTGLSVVVHKILSKESDKNIYFILNSIMSLLNYNNTQKTYRFVETLQNYLDNYDADCSCFVFDKSFSKEEDQYNSIKSLF